MGVQACRLPALKPLKRLKGLKRLKTLVQACRLPALKPALKRHRLNIPLACFILQPAGTPRPHINGFFMGVQACRLPALKPLKRLKGLKRLKTLKMLKTLNGRPSLPFASPEPSPEMPSLKHSLGMLHPAASRHPKATHQWLLMGVQACRLPALKPLKTLKNPRPSLPFASPETSPATPSLKHSPGMLHSAASRHPKATHQWLLMGVQACRLPALKPLKRLKGLKRLKTLKMLKTLNGRPSPVCQNTYETPPRHPRPHTTETPPRPAAVNPTAPICL